MYVLFEINWSKVSLTNKIFGNQKDKKQKENVEFSSKLIQIQNIFSIILCLLKPLLQLEEK